MDPSGPPYGVKQKKFLKMSSKAIKEFKKQLEKLNIEKNLLLDEIAKTDLRTILFEQKADALKKEFNELKILYDFIHS